MHRLSQSTISEFCDIVSATGLRRAYFVFDPQRNEVLSSHPELNELRDELHQAPDFNRHEAVFLELGSETRALFGAFIHRTSRGQAAGGLRYWSYDTIFDYLRDGLRLAQGMGRKNALAGLWWGGGKGIIARTSEHAATDPTFRRRLYSDYGRFVSSLRGAYVTAEDVGTLPEDVASVFTTTRFVTCVPQSVGGSGNPSMATAKGVICAMEGALSYTRRGDLKGKRIVMQGAGNVGTYMLAELLEKGVSHVLVGDICDESLDKVRRRFSEKLVSVALLSAMDTSLYSQDADIFVPNALGGILNPETIPLIRAPLVCGAANNQLLDDRRDDKLLRARGIVYVPDFVANRMGIVNCANEQYGSLPDDPAISRHFGRDWENSVYRITQAVLARADTQGITSTEAANALADEYAEMQHPIWPHRTRQIIQSLVDTKWHKG